MTKRIFAGAVALLGALTIWCSPAEGQSDPAASQRLELSVFGAGTGTYTGLYDGRNAGITAGIDLTLPRYHHFDPAIELRGNTPISKGDVDGQKSALIGPKVSRRFGRFHPYVDGFFGRGQFEYLNGGIIADLPDGTGFLYKKTTTNVYAGGGGLDYQVSRHFDLKADALYERWGTPVYPGGVVYSTALSAGVVYHLDFNQYHRHHRR